MSEIKILVVDDEEVIRDLLKDIISAMGHEAVLAVDGKDGLNKFGTRDFNLVITDIRMPNMNGVEMYRKLKEKGYNGPILFITGDAPADLIEAINKIEQKGFLKKPFDMAAIMGEINQALSPEVESQSDV